MDNLYSDLNSSLIRNNFASSSERTSIQSSKIIHILREYFVIRVLDGEMGIDVDYGEYIDPCDFQPDSFIIDEVEATYREYDKGYQIRIIAINPHQGLFYRFSGVVFKGDSGGTVVNDSTSEVNVIDSLA